MVAHARPEAAPAPRGDQRVVMHGVPWSLYERLGRQRGESSIPRLAYLDGELELMSPSDDHDLRSRGIGFLLMAYADQMGIDLTGFGSWTQKSAGKKAGLEPDECFVVGARRKKRPDLAVEVIWSSGSVDKLEIYRRLGIGEVWFWRKGAFEVHVLERRSYIKKTGSALFPNLDLDLLGSFVEMEPGTRAVREYRRALQTRARRR